MIFNGKEIANYHQPYVIAEIGANHNGDVNLAKKMIDQAKEAGCDCVKFQSWTKDSIFAKEVYEQNYFLKDDYRDRNDYTLEEIVEDFSLQESELYALKQYCDHVQIDFASTPFSKKEVDFLVDELKVNFIKVASMDSNNYPFLDYIARKGMPVMLSTGLSTMSEIDEAVQTIEKTGNKNLIILHCVSNYPPKEKNVHLNNIDMLRDNYPEYPVGYSDHTLGVEIPLASVVKGSCVIEKHFTLDKDMFGWDHKVSATQEEMIQIVNGSNKIVQGLGSYRRVLSDDDYVKMKAFRRSIVAAREIPEGKIIDEDDLGFKRPGTGIPPKYLSLIIGRKAKRSITFDDVLSLEDF